MRPQQSRESSGNKPSLSGQEKVAALFLALGENRIGKLFALMSDDEIKEISQIMSNLGSIESKHVETLFLDFVEQGFESGKVVGNIENTERLLGNVLPKDRVNNIMEEIRGPAGRTMWDKLGNVSDVVLANYLKNEYPQTAAVILTKIKTEHAAAVLSKLPEEFATDVMCRMLKMESIQKEVLEEVEKTLRNEFMNNLARTSKRDSHELIAEIFNNFDRSTEAKFMKALEEKSVESAEKIKSLMFTFEDLLKIDGAGIQTLMRSIDKDKLGIALKGASQPIKDLFFNNMSERAAKILKEDMEAMGPVRIKDVDEAQSKIIASVKELADKGEITLASNKEEDQMVY